MSNYTPITDFGAKDALSTGNPSKLILGTEVDAEFDAIATAVATKIDSINSLSTETTIESNDVEIFYDTTAGSHKKITNINKRRPIIQIYHRTDAGSTRASTTYGNLNSSTIPITPVSASSNLLIEVSFRGRIGNVTGVNNLATFSIYESGSVGTALSEEYPLEAFSSSGGLGAGAPCYIRVSVASTGTATRRFGLQGKCGDATSILTGTLMVWTITEYI